MNFRKGLADWHDRSLQELSEKGAKENGMKSLGKRTVASVSVALATVALAIAPAMSATAATTLTDYDVHTSQEVKIYPQKFMKYSHSWASLNVTKIPPCGGYIRVGLRAYNSGVQYAVNQYNGVGSKTFYWTANNHAEDGRTPVGSYGLNGKLVGVCSPATQYWSGVLSF